VAGTLEAPDQLRVQAQLQRLQRARAEARAAALEEEEDEGESNRGGKAVSWLRDAGAALMTWLRPSRRARQRSARQRQALSNLSKAALALASLAVLQLFAGSDSPADAEPLCKPAAAGLNHGCSALLGPTAACVALASAAESTCWLLDTFNLLALPRLILWALAPPTNSGRRGKGAGGSLFGGLMSFWTRLHGHAPVGKGLMARCTLLPLQHHCALGGHGHVDRLRWHLDTVQRLLGLEREGAFGADGHCDERCGSLSLSRWSAGIRKHTGAYSLLCEQQFGEGAEFDGEMCACRKGFVVKGGMCRRPSKGGDARQGGDNSALEEPKASYLEKSMSNACATGLNPDGTRRFVLNCFSIVQIKEKNADTCRKDGSCGAEGARSKKAFRRGATISGGLKLQDSA